MGRAWFIAAAATCVVFACTSFEDSADVPDAGADGGGPSDAPPPSPDATSDASADGGDAATNARRPCSAIAPAPNYCLDFETTTLPANWAISDGGTGAVEIADGVAKLSGNGGNASASIGTVPLLARPAKITMSTRMKIDIGPAGTDVDIVLAQMQTGMRQDYLVVKAQGTTLKLLEAAYEADGGGIATLRFEYSPTSATVSPATWFELTFVLDLGTTPTAHLFVDGVERSTFPLQYSQLMNLVQLRMGENNVGGGMWNITYDDLVVRLE